MKPFRIRTLLEQFLEVKLSETRDEAGKLKARALHSNIKALEKTSGKMITWSLSLIGGSFLAILSEEYIHPENKEYRYPYFLFVIGWVFFAFSINYGMNISRFSSAADRNEFDLELLIKGNEQCQGSFSKQITTFKWGLLVFGIWLLLYLCWWILSDLPVKTK